MEGKPKSTLIPRSLLWDCWETLSICGCCIESSCVTDCIITLTTLRNCSWTQYRHDGCASSPGQFCFAIASHFCFDVLASFRAEAVLWQRSTLHSKLERSWEPVRSVLLCTFCVNVICSFGVDFLAQTQTVPINHLLSMAVSSSQGTWSHSADSILMIGGNFNYQKPYCVWWLKFMQYTFLSNVWVFF